VTRRLVLGAAVAGGGLYLRALVRRPAWVPAMGTTRRAGPLSVRVLGEGAPVVLLHGLVGSGRFWDGSYDRLARRRCLVVPDLLGFGRSDRPGHGYGPDDHADAVAAALDALDVREPAVVVGHSLGCVIALRLAAIDPDRVERVVGFGPPLYPDAAAARARLGASGPMAKLFVLPGPAAERACRWVCDHRSVSAAVAQWTHPSLPPVLAADGVEHTWQSYSETMERCLLTGQPSTWVGLLSASVRLVAGADDRVVDAGFVSRLAERHAGVSFESWPGDHRLPLTHPEACRSAIEDAVAATGR
jgi:pimeloyl-ACP methyl ester carboxylesterase